VTRVVISGAAGRLGARVLALALRDPSLEVDAAVVRAGSTAEGRSLAELGGLPGTSALAATAELRLVPGQVLIETAPRAAALAHARLAAESGVPTLMATTGFEPAERRALEAHAARIPLLIAPNLSLGVAVLTDLVARASRALGGYHLEVLELHHARKRDAPSGTAWALGRAAAEARGQDVERDAILARAGEIGPRGEAEIGMQSLRGGDVVGEHTVFLFGPTERLELTHRAASRDAFAAGALAAARFLGAPGRAPGLYDMRDVLGLA
jgi:4-hydroxy-tetrahydrodipicolinate reductase